MNFENIQKGNLLQHYFEVVRVLDFNIEEKRVIAQSLTTNEVINGTLCDFIPLSSHKFFRTYPKNNKKE